MTLLLLLVWLPETVSGGMPRTVALAAL